MALTPIVIATTTITTIIPKTTAIAIATIAKATATKMTTAT